MVGLSDYPTGHILPADNRGAVLYTEFEYGPEAVAYIREVLSWGKTLAAHLRSLPLEEGRVVAYLPVNTSVEARHKFRTGGIASTRETRSWLMSSIFKYLGEPGKRYAVFEEPNLRVGDSYLDLHKEHEQFFSHASEIYTFLTLCDCQSEEKASLLVYRAQIHYFLGVLTSTAEDERDIQIYQAVTEDFLARLASRTEHLIIGAYDGEAESVWSRANTGFE